MKIIIPMAGTGKRFIDAGYNIIKPLIDIGGRPMIEQAINIFNKEEDFIFICNAEHLTKTNLGEILKKAKPKGKILPIPSHKLGPVYTVLESKASDLIKDDEPVIVNYCDFYVDWDYDDFKDTITKNGCDGCVTAYRGFHPHLLGNGFYAGVRADEENNLVQIKEKHSFTKNKMDSFHSAGTYYFKKGCYIKKYFNMLMDKKLNTNGEYYVSMVYHLMKEDGLNIYVYKIMHFLQWGTPEDMEEQLYWAEYFRSKNKAGAQRNDY